MSLRHLLWRIIGRYCPKCGSYDVEVITHEEEGKDYDYSPLGPDKYYHVPPDEYDVRHTIKTVMCKACGYEIRRKKWETYRKQVG